MAAAPAVRIWETPEWAALVEDAAAAKAGAHIRDLLHDAARCAAMSLEAGGLTLDYARQLTTGGTMARLFALARAAGLPGRIHDMARGAHLNTTEDRAVLHMALRAPRGASLVVDGEDVVPGVVRERPAVMSCCRRVVVGTRIVCVTS
jgi:glucose-6-phosphate isomerase